MSSEIRRSMPLLSISIVMQLTDLTARQIRYYEEHDLIPKKYKVNEYNLVNITDKQKANIYLIDYRNELISNREKAYNHLNSEYKDAKFPTIEEFNEYVDTINIQNISLEKYSFSNNGNFLEIYYSNDNSFIFKIKGILDYEVYFDDTTVEMK